MWSRYPCRFFDFQRLDPLGYLRAKISCLVHSYWRIDVVGEGGDQLLALKAGTW